MNTFAEHHVVEHLCEHFHECLCEHFHKYFQQNTSTPALASITTIWGGTNSVRKGVRKHNRKHLRKGDTNYVNKHSHIYTYTYT